MDRMAKVRRFQALHTGEGAFVVPNPWDAGSARLLASLGFPALATTSAGYAFSCGRRDSFAALSRDELLANAAEIAGATDLPVSADLEDGFGPAPETCAQTIRMAAAAEAARATGFVLTARAENFLWGRPDLDDTIRRLQAFEAAGANVLYAPGLPDLNAIRRVCAAVRAPVNVVMGLSGHAYSVAELAAVGVRRISVGGSFARAALGALMRAACEVRDHGTFTYAAQALPDAEVSRLMAQDRCPERS